MDNHVHVQYANKISMYTNLCPYPYRSFLLTMTTHSWVLAIYSTVVIQYCECSQCSPKQVTTNSFFFPIFYFTSWPQCPPSSFPSLLPHLPSCPLIPSSFVSFQKRVCLTMSSNKRWHIKFAVRLSTSQYVKAEQVTHYAEWGPKKQ